MHVRMNTSNPAPPKNSKNSKSPIRNHLAASSRKPWPTLTPANTTKNYFSKSQPGVEHLNNGGATKSSASSPPSTTPQNLSVDFPDSKKPFAAARVRLGDGNDVSETWKLESSIRERIFIACGTLKSVERCLHTNFHIMSKFFLLAFLAPASSFRSPLVPTCLGTPRTNRQA